MLAKFDLTRRTFGYLEVLEFAGTDKRGETLWLCQCHYNGCTNTKTIVGSRLRYGRNISCGCYNRNRPSRPHWVKKHGHSHKGAVSPIYRAWRHMLDNCYNPNAGSYKHYGGRGITVCDRWRADFRNFLADMGDTYQQGLSLVRLKDDGNYEPPNCEWGKRKRADAGGSHRRTERERLQSYSKINGIFSRS